MTKRFSAAALIRDRKILLALRHPQRPFYPGVWDFIGGHCNQNETFEQTLIRELYEELNIKPLDYTRFMSVDKSPDFVLELFIVRDWKGELTNNDPAEHLKIQWFEFDELKVLDFPDPEYPKFLAALFDSAFLGEARK